MNTFIFFYKNDKQKRFWVGFLEGINWDIYSEGTSTCRFICPRDKSTQAEDFEEMMKLGMKSETKVIFWSINDNEYRFELF